MSEHLDLLGLLRGELGNAEAISAGEHLRDCAQCREDLADSVVGHALLTRAGATLGRDHDAPPPPALVVPRAARHPRRTRVLVAAAAAVVVAAGATSVVLLQDRDQDPGPTVAAVSASLGPLATSDHGDGEVSMVETDGRTRMTLAVHGLPQAAPGDYYYAWLLDPASQKMLPLGQVDPAAGATFDVADSLVASYSAIDVSLEADDGDPAHSVTSVLRGSYEPDQITTAEGNNR